MRIGILITAVMAIHMKGILILLILMERRQLSLSDCYGYKVDSDHDDISEEDTSESYESEQYSDDNDTDTEDSYEEWDNDDDTASEAPSDCVTSYF